RHTKNVIRITHHEPILKRPPRWSAGANVSLVYLGLRPEPCKSSEKPPDFLRDSPKASPSRALLSIPIVATMTVEADRPIDFNRNGAGRLDITRLHRGRGSDRAFPAVARGSGGGGSQ